ncbi:MAG: GGDEF domain-containing protein [Proteobacteria bacterium]|nr:GGDEF domain-containing protein [Pseudomonadota bacterium]
MSNDDRTLIDEVPCTLRSEVRLSREPDLVKTPTVTVVAGPNPGTFVSIERANRAVFVGRDATCEFPLDDPSVSRRHARIYLERLQSAGEALVVLQDLQSTNGTLVNGEQVDRATLKHGDRIHIGDVLLRFEMLDQVDIDYRDGIARRVQEGERDSLTGLLSRQAMDNHLPALIEHCDQGDAPVSAVMMDLDHFKKVNDTMGHPIGDAVLKETGQLVRDAIRREDLAIRYGGEEFLLVLAGARRLHARLLAERLREGVARTEFAEIPGLRITCSLGVAERAPGEPVKEWLQRADDALYRAKDKGRNRSEASKTPRQR